MTGRPRTHHFIIVYFADWTKKEVDVYYRRTISWIEWNKTKILLIHQNKSLGCGARHQSHLALAASSCKHERPADGPARRPTRHRKHNTHAVPPHRRWEDDLLNSYHISFKTTHSIFSILKNISTFRTYHCNIVYLWDTSDKYVDTDNSGTIWQVKRKWASVSQISVDGEEGNEAGTYTGTLQRRPDTLIMSSDYLVPTRTLRAFSNQTMKLFNRL